MLSSLKAIIKESKWNGCENEKSYDEWFTDFATKVLSDYLYMKEDETLDIKTALENLTEEKPKVYDPVYLQTAGRYAKEHGEIEQFRLSYRLNQECKSAIEKAVSEIFDGMQLNEGFENKLIEEYGYDSVAHICTSTIVESEDN